MEYNNLRYFKAAAETENFTRAAELMGVSQAYLSRIVRRLEDDLGVPLFVRAGRRVELNQYGKHLYEATNNCFRTIHNARNEISNVLSTDKQRVRLVARSPLGDFPAVLKGFYDQNPDITVPVITPGDDTIGINYDLEYFASHEKCGGGNVRELCDGPYVLLVSEGNELANRSQIALKELKDVGFVISPYDTQMTRVQTRMFELAGFRPKIRCYSSSYWALLNLVEQNVGVCIGCEKSWLAKIDLKIKAIPLSDIHVSRKLYLQWPLGAYLTDATLALIEYLETIFTGSSKD